MSILTMREIMDRLSETIVNEGSVSLIDAKNHMSIEDFVAAAQKQFAFYGYVSCPLSDEELVRCYEAGVDPYPVGCDVDGGYSFEDSLQANS